MSSSVALALALALAPGVAAAGTTPISELPRTARTAEGTALAVPKGLDATADGVNTTDGCLLYEPAPHWASGAEELGDTWRGQQASSSTFGLERLVVRGGATVLERTVIGRDGAALVVAERGRIALREVARLPDGSAVYAYRRADRVYIVAATAASSRIRVDTGSDNTLNRTVECTVAVTQLRIIRGQSESVQIQAGLPNRSDTPFIVDASISKTRRDPEPLLAVSVRTF